MPITTPCPKCKKVLFQNAYFVNDGMFEIKCKWCDSVIHVVISKVTKIVTSMLE